MGGRARRQDSGDRLRTVVPERGNAWGSTWSFPISPTLLSEAMTASASCSHTATRITSGALGVVLKRSTCPFTGRLSHSGSRGRRLEEHGIKATFMDIVAPGRRTIGPFKCRFLGVIALIPDAIPPSSTRPTDASSTQGISRSTKPPSMHGTRTSRASPRSPAKG